MSRKSKGQKNKGQKKSAALSTRPPPIRRDWTLLKRLWTAVVIFLALLGGVSALVSLLPRLSLEVSAPLDRSNPFSAIVTIRNTGQIPLRKIQPMLGICGIAGEPIPPPHAVLCSGPIGPLIAPTWMFRKSLAIDEAYDIPMDDILRFIHSPVSYAEISFVLQYHPWYLPWTRTSEFKLITRRHEDGTIDWLHETLE